MSGAGAGSSSFKLSTKDILTQLANILPTSTFMAFQVIAPLVTNNGNCGATEKVVTAVLLVVFTALVAFSCFTDSVKVADTGNVYYGIVTTRGLWNPSFQNAGIPGAAGAFYGGTEYKLRAYDFVNATLSVVAFGALTLLTDPVTSCFYRKLSATVVKTVPLIVGVVVSFVVSFAPPARNGVGYAVSGSAGTSSASLLQPASSSHGATSADP